MYWANRLVDTGKESFETEIVESFVLFFLFSLPYPGQCSKPLNPLLSKPRTGTVCAEKSGLLV